MDPVVEVMHYGPHGNRCGSKMKIVAFIDDDKVISRILSHLGLLSPKEDSRGPPTEASSASPASSGDGFEVQSEFTWDQTADEPAWADNEVPAEAGGEGYGDGDSTEEKSFFEDGGLADETFDACDSGEGE